MRSGNTELSEGGALAGDPEPANLAVVEDRPDGPPHRRLFRISGRLDVADDDQSVGVSAGRCEAEHFHGRDVVRRQQPQRGRQGTGELVLELFAEPPEAVAVRAHQGGVERVVDDVHGTAEQVRRPGANISAVAFALSFLRLEEWRRRRRMVRPAGEVDRWRVTTVRGRGEVLVVPVTVARRLE